MRATAAFVVALAALLGASTSALAQQAPPPPRASGPPIAITPPASVYKQAPPRAAAPRATATATTAAEILHVPQPTTLDCGAEIAVWANPASRIYHFSTSDYYGRTKIGSYMCESDAKAQGMRPGRTEVRP